MATTTAFTSLPVPAPDDSMEMSSPANRPLDDDIDIDFEDYHGGVQVIADEHMLEDDEARPGTGTDDMMEDDLFPSDQTLAGEEVMQDSGAHVQEAVQDEDDELIDYGEDDFQDHSVEDTILPNAEEEPPILAFPGAPQLGAAIETTSMPPTEAASEVTEAASEAAQTRDLSGAGESLPQSYLIAEESVLEEVDDSAHDFAQTAALESEGYDFAEDDAQPTGLSVHTEVNAEDNTPGTPTDTGLHPMTVRYGDMEMPLFKSRRQPDGLLKDDNLASLSLAEFMKNCRKRLAIKIGEDLSEDQELLLGFDRLGLLLVEDSRAAFESSLNDILEVYLQLHRNDGIEEIPSLALTLSLQLKFASSFSILKQAASGGQGMSTFGFLHSAGDDEYYLEQYEDAGDVGLEQNEHNEDFREDEQDDQGDGEPNDYEDAAAVGDGHAQNEDTTGQYDEEEYYEEENSYQEDNATHADESDQGQRQLETAGASQAQEHLISEQKNPADDSLETGQEIATTTHPDTAQVPAGEAHSTGSSTTVQGDPAVDNNNIASAPDGNDDYSTFLTELEAEDQEAATANDVQQVLDGGAAAKHDSSIPADEHTAEPEDDQHHLGSEDFLYDSGTHEDGGEGQYEYQDPGHDATDEHGEDGGAQDEEKEEQQEEEEEENSNQADPYDEQQEEQYHPDYEPGADNDEDEQFHTAQDFLNGGGDYYEHGPEHDHNLQDEDGLDDSTDTVVHHPVDVYTQHEAEQNIEDDLEFGDYEENTFEQQQDDEAVSQQEQQHQPRLSGSLHGKRSFDELADNAYDDDFEDVDDERELKKARAA